MFQCHDHDHPVCYWLFQNVHLLLIDTRAVLTWCQNEPSRSMQK